MSVIIAKKGDRGSHVRVIQRLLYLIPDGIFGPLTEEAVIDFQQKMGIKPDGIVGPMTWSHLFHSPATPGRRKIDTIVVHCSDTPAGRHVTVDDITRWHQDQGWNTIGYHFVVYLDGTVHPGRPVDIIGAHCKGHNSHSIGVCYIGGRTADNSANADTRTQAQKDTLLSLIRQLRHTYPHASVFGHGDLDPRPCPCFDAKSEYSRL